MSDVRFDQVVAALKDRATVRSTEALFGADAESARYMAQMLENTGLLGPADAHGVREVLQSAVRYWLRAHDFGDRLDAEQVLHRSTLNDLRATRDALGRANGAREDAERKLRLARGTITNLETRRYAAFLSALAGWGFALLLGVTLAWVVIA
ncbi:hypothetical protein [Glycomyces sp. MUSA5-2]|uniref:hypothetical protein n=1 Tax=Glycomyces sp. MUSA5-2 TaxID=2053002 RepID=UPI00300A9E4A